MSTLATTLTADTSFNLLFANSQSDSVILTVSAGTAAGTYLVVDGDKNGDYTAADLVVKLVSPVGSLSGTTVVDSNTSITLAAAGDNFTGTAADDNLNVAALTATGTLKGEGGNNTISATTGADIKGSTITNFTNLSLASGAGITMTVAQHNAFTGAVTAPGTETITLSDAGTVTALANVEKYTLANAFTSFTDNSLSNTITLGTGSNAVVMSGGGTDSVVTGASGTTTLTVSAATGTVAVTNVGTGGTPTAGITATISGAATFTYDSANTGNQTDIVNFSRALTTSDKFLADDATDTTTLNLNASQGAEFTFAALNFTNVDTVNLGLAGGTYNLVTKTENNIEAIKNKADVLLTGPITIDTSNETSAVTVDLTVTTGAAVTPTGVATIKISGTAATAAANTVKTGSGADSVTFTAAVGNVTANTVVHTIATGLGDDTIAITTATTAIAADNLAINGGGGADTLNLTQGVATTADASDIIAVETVNVGGAFAFSWTTANADIAADTTVNVLSSATAGVTIAGSLLSDKALTVTVAATTKASAYSIKSDADGVVNDSVTFTLADNDGVENADTVDLATGTGDSIRINLNGKNLGLDTSTTNTFGLGVETITIAGAAATATSGFSFVIDKDAQTAMTLLDASGVTNGGTISVGDFAQTTALTIKAAQGTAVVNLLGQAGSYTVDVGAGSTTVTAGLTPTSGKYFTLSNFAAANDVINLIEGTSTAVSVVMAAGGTQVVGATLALAATSPTAGLYLAGNGTGGQAAMQISGALTQTADGGAVELAIINAGVVAADSNGQFGIVVLDNGTDTGIYKLTRNTDTGGTSTLLDRAGDFSVTLLGVITGLADAGTLGTANII